MGENGDEALGARQGGVENTLYDRLWESVVG